MVPKGVDGDASHFRIFTAHVIALDQRLHLAAYCRIEGALTGDGCLSLCFSTAAAGSSCAFAGGSSTVAD
jgi:hypothetical protein